MDGSLSVRSVELLRRSPRGWIDVHNVYTAVIGIPQNVQLSCFSLMQFHQVGNVLNFLWGEPIGYCGQFYFSCQVGKAFVFVFKFQVEMGQYAVDPNDTQVQPPVSGVLVSNDTLIDMRVVHAALRERSLDNAAVMLRVGIALDD